MKVAQDFGLSVSIAKTKVMATGRLVLPNDEGPIHCDDCSSIEAVQEFQYLGSIVERSGRADSEVGRRVMQASRAFGCLRRAVFKDKDLTMKTKKNIYQACVLLYASECWTLLQRHKRKLDAPHHRCVRTILGITNRQQWEQRITSVAIRQRWGDTMTVTQMVAARRMEWLGHLACMPTHCTPQKCLFGWLPQPRPQGGPKKRWKDVVMADLKDLKVPEANWFESACASVVEWRATYREVLMETADAPHSLTAPQPPLLILCQVCRRRFRREGDRKRHKCLAERQKPVCQQRGAAQCPTCHKWFRSKGGLAVHRCS